MRLKLGFNEGGLGAAMDPVEAALVGTGGFALDFSDTSRMWTTSTKTTLVAAASDPIGAIRSKWGAAEYDFLQSSGTSRLSWNGSNAADFAGGTNHLTGAAAAGLLNAKPAAFFCGKVVLDALFASQAIMVLSTTTGAAYRFIVQVGAAGAVTVAFRRVDGGTGTVVTSADGVIAAGTPAVITASCDYAGTRGIVIRVNGVQVTSGTLTEAAGNTSATNSANFYIGRNNSSLTYMDGRSSRMVFADKVFTPDDISIIEAWVGQGALT